MLERMSTINIDSIKLMTENNTSVQVSGSRNFEDFNFVLEQDLMASKSLEDFSPPVSTPQAVLGNYYFVTKEASLSAHIYLNVI